MLTHSEMCVVTKLKKGFNVGVAVLEIAAGEGRGGAAGEEGGGGCRGGGKGGGANPLW